MGARRHFSPRVAASRWAATQGVAATWGAARRCSGGQEEVGKAGLKWTLKASDWSGLCLNVSVCNEHIGSRPASTLHEECNHELTDQDFGRRGQVHLDEQRLEMFRRQVRPFAVVKLAFPALGALPALHNSCAHSPKPFLSLSIHLSSPAQGPCGRLERSFKGSKVAESSLGPEGAAQELLQVVSRTCLP
uniref:Uncharacterized protein n=1 Tax=Chromera velia CCMP2878 TaxID=1169474 RepID=A0A0G4FDY2_9ALVE|eukprot:Cvel_16540.t1-p1 / transcript=Cvel_16540.t1 / gene=Cvel_16540 / organism=Chromera_velia_CCMP2878 / gene_product=hypothetical protein / transcript_product=hypothetical protein / location=Cvel_scaffold1278:35171-36224(+) / protein_length=189 / sequence_SO=supercontig / SO=protein_coding / is_pseudo=false